ncbi:MAG: phosphotransferase [Gemmatimonadota bacterium]
MSATEAYDDARESPFGVMEPPPRDCPLDAGIVGRVLREQFPAMPFRSIERLGSGWERDVFLVDGEVAVHFPRYAGVADGLDRHAAILELVAGNVGPTVVVPEITLWGKAGRHYPHRFFGHAPIPGVEADPLERPDSPELAFQLGATLSEIHAIPTSAAERIGIVDAPGSLEADLATLVGQAEQVGALRKVAPLAFGWLRDGPHVPEEYPGPPRFLHGDLQPEHIIVMPVSKRLSGIIDWSGAALGDPALDFSYLLVLHGRKFLERALAAYRLPLDEAFLERTAFRGRVRALGWLVYALFLGMDLRRVRQEVDNAFSLAPA